MGFALGYSSPADVDLTNSGILNESEASWFSVRQFHFFVNNPFVATLYESGHFVGQSVCTSKRIYNEARSTQRLRAHLQTPCCRAGI